MEVRHLPPTETILKLTSSWRLVPDAVLWRSSLEAVPLAADALLLLPQAARVERDDVREPVRHGRNLVGFVPGQKTQVVVPEIWASTF